MSTVFALVARFYEPDPGQLLFDGRPATALSRAVCRERIAVVDQNTYVVHGALWDNLAYAAPGATESEVRGVIEPAGRQCLPAAAAGHRGTRRPCRPPRSHGPRAPSTVNGPG
ncbi:hypothetical protein GCM10023324_68540 [Streptomyces youssoufiensis]